MHNCARDSGIFTQPREPPLKQLTPKELTLIARKEGNFAEANGANESFPVFYFAIQRMAIDPYAVDKTHTILSHLGPIYSQST